MHLQTESIAETAEINEDRRVKTIIYLYSASVLSAIDSVSGLVAFTPRRLLLLILRRFIAEARFLFGLGASNSPAHVTSRGVKE